MPDTIFLDALATDALQELQGIYTGHDLLLGVDAFPFADDESHALKPAPVGAVFPRCHEQVVQTVQWARRHRIALVPSGGRTGLSGGACAGHGELVLNLAKMQRIIDFDAIGGFLTVEAGVVLEVLQDYASDRGWLYPVDYASRGSAQIGGAVATNAGGIRVLRYGMTRDWVAGLKAVTGTGDTLEFNRHLQKDNAGYDLKDLLVGSEGTLAIITEVTVRLTRLMAEQQTLLVGVDSIADMLNVFAAMRKAVTLNAAEFFCAHALWQVMARHGFARPLAAPHAYYLLLEFDLSALTLDALAGLLDGYDVVISQRHEQTQQLWRYRELVSSSINPLRPYKIDIACSLARLPDWFADLEQGFADVDNTLQPLWFGHLGDGNVHLNILRPEDMGVDRFDAAISECVRVIGEVTRRHHATISAEHGIGVLKRSLLGYARSDEELAIYRQIRQVFDPDAILNPGKLL